MQGILGETATGSPEETLIHTHNDLTQGIVITIDASFSVFCEQLLLFNSLSSPHLH